MIKQGWRKCLLLLMAVVLLLPLASTPRAFAAVGTTTPPAEGAEGGEANGANEMSRSMISFFREDRTNLQVERVSRDELIVYGVFMSNFYVPWQTRLGDMIKDEGDKSMPKQISTKFFGSADKSKQITEINKKLHDAIHGVLGFDKKAFGMYKKKSSTDSTMSGTDFYNKLAGKDTEPKIYNASGQVMLDLSDRSTNAALQVLFGISPEYMLSSSKGLRKVTAMYMDGLGNIWGAYDKADVNDYVLILPASLNPSVFDVNGAGLQFPAANVFSMGATLKVESDFISDKSWMTPYYNIKQHIPASTYNKGNVVNIFGIQSATDSIGNSDSIIRDGVDANPFSKVKDMLSENTSSTMNKAQSNVIISIDTDKVKDLSKHLKEGNSLNTEQRSNLVDYLFKTSTFKLDKLADDMYYFDVPLASAQNASGGEGSFDDVNSMIAKQELFAKEESEGNWQYYDKSSMSSPFNKWLYTFINTKESEQAKLLKDKIGGSVKTSSPEFKALLSFMQKGTWGTKNAETVNKAMILLEGKSNHVYSLVPPSKNAAGIIIESSWQGLFGSKAITTSYALTDKDTNTAIMSIAATNADWWSKLVNNYGATTKTPFEVTKEGGKIASKESMTDKHTRSMSNYFHNFMSYRIFSMNSTFTKNLTGMASGSKIVTPWDKEAKTKTAIMNGVNNYPGIYWGYMVGLLNIKAKADGSGFEDPTPYSNSRLPFMEISTLGGGLDLNDAFGVAGVVSSEDKTLIEMQKEIVHKVYGLLSGGPNSARDEIIKATQDSWIISTHRAITGSWVGETFSVSAGGGGSYASVVGYINTPSLTDLPLTDWIVDDYMYVYMLFLLITLIVVVLMVMTSTRTFREGLLIFIVMAFVLVIPQFLVGNVINLSNKAGDKLYSERFNYWALTQHEQSLSNLSNSRLTGDELDYLVVKNMENSKNSYTNDVGVRVKWMSPKKDNVFDSIFNERTASQNLLSNLTLFRWLTSSQLNQEEYVYNDPLATYLYRPYNAIAQDAKDSYESLDSVAVAHKDATGKSLAKTKGVLGLPDYRFAYYKEPAGKIKYDEKTKKIVDSAGAYKTSSDLTKLESYRYWAINNQTVTDAIFRSNFVDNAGVVGAPTDPYYNAFTLSTESPFYYFYNVFKHRYANDGGEFKSAILDEDMFRVKSTEANVNGAMRDFLDLEGMFKYVIPYLHQGNQYVYGWTDIYGKDIDGFNFDATRRPVVDTKASKEKQDEQAALIAQFDSEQVKKDKLRNVWKLYTPWVDQLYSLDDVYTTKVSVAGKNKVIDDTVNPGSYETVGRPMIFSEADMYAKSYRYSDLSDIERRIQATLDSTYKELLYLSNYHDFKDEALITAAAMTATFNFNREFSDNRLLGESAIMYPQNYELKNFNYDAFMRLMLLNATGEPMMADEDLYSRILDKTSLITGIILILCDILAVIIIPTAKVVVLLLLLFLSIIVSISCILTPPDKLAKTIIKCLGVPSLLFLVASIGFAFVISLFMGEGLTGYVGGKSPDLGLSDPTVTMGLMVVVDLIYLFLLYMVAKMLLTSLKSHLVSSFFSSVSLAAGAGVAMIGQVTDRFKRGAANRAGQAKHDELVDAFKGGGSSEGGAGGGSPSGGIGGAGGVSGFGAEASTADANNPESKDTVGGMYSGGSDRSNASEDPDSATSFKNDIDAMASSRGMGGSGDSESSTTDENIIKRRALGHKMVDFKHNLRSTTQELRDGVKYTASSQGLRKDVIDSLKETTVRTNNYRNDVRQYDNDKELENIVRQDSKRGYVKNVDARQAKGFERIERNEQKISATERRNALLRNANGES